MKSSLVIIKVNIKSFRWLTSVTWSLSAEDCCSLKTSVASNLTMNGATPSSGRITWPITWPTSTFRAHSVRRSVYTAGNLPALPLLLCLWFHSTFQSHRHASICLQASAGDLSLLCSSLLCIYVRLCIGIGEVRARTPKFMCLFAASISISTRVVRLNSFCDVAIYLQFCGYTTRRSPSLLGTLTVSASVLIEPQTCASESSESREKIWYSSKNLRGTGKQRYYNTAEDQKGQKNIWFNRISVFVSLPSYLLFCVFVRETIVIVLFRKVHPLRRCLEQVFKSWQLHSAEVCRTPRHHVKGPSEEGAEFFVLFFLQRVSSFSWV